MYMLQCKVPYPKTYCLDLKLTFLLWESPGSLAILSVPVVIAAMLFALDPLPVRRELFLT